MVSVTDRLPTCLQNPPDAVDGLAADVAGGGVLSPVVQRPPVVCHLDGAIGPLGGAERTDGSVQVTYDGWPLYYWAQDAAAGDVSGQAVNGVWWVLQASGEPIRD